MNSKYSNILTLVLIIIVVAILGICVYYGYDYYTQDAGDEQAQKAVEEFNKNTKENRKVVSVSTKNNNKEENTVAENTVEPIYEQIYEQVQNTTVTEEPEVTEPETPEEPEVVEPEKQYLEGYEITGTIKIPKTGIEYPVLSEVTKKSLETSVAILYGPGVNKEGNTDIVGHNYRNKRFFSNNDKLSNGDTFTLTDVYGETVTYVIYKMFYTTPDDADYMIRTINPGVREVSLSTCNDDSSQRLIIQAVEQSKYDQRSAE